MEMGGARQGGEATPNDIKQELEKILVQLDQIFLSTESQSNLCLGLVSNIGIAPSSFPIGHRMMSS